MRMMGNDMPGGILPVDDEPHIIKALTTTQQRKTTVKISFSEIPEQGLRIELQEDTWFPDQEITRTAPVKAVVTLARKGAARVLMEGMVETTISLECDRCLESFPMALAGDFKIDLEYLANDPGQPAEHQCSSSEMETVFLDEPAIDLYELLSQQVFLLLPLKRLCNEECHGLCPQCGANRNTGPCRCDQKMKTTPFSVLATMKR